MKDITVITSALWKCAEISQCLSACARLNEFHDEWLLKSVHLSEQLTKLLSDYYDR